MDFTEDNGIVDLRQRMRMRQEEEEAKKRMEETPKPDNNRPYEIKMKSGDILQSSGVLMLTGAFFALGMPVPGNEGAVDFNWAAPADQVEYIIALSEDDLVDE